MRSKALDEPRSRTKTQPWTNLLISRGTLIRVIEPPPTMTALRSDEGRRNNDGESDLEGVYFTLLTQKRRLVLRLRFLRLILTSFIIVKSFAGE
ncbi:hypothetical protein L484_000026 [Morus notabilis]|uniref:Uncharacterized protein n=1 Tax=Morus notabilis TaxID=981085 RepID=W9SGP6_9ROSA|nr:hypothetical protein L484_006568 [Morus notabilis]EXC62282.1 hypothetical protein L484_000026 [Morus notabilis]